MIESDLGVTYLGRMQNWHIYNLSAGLSLITKTIKLLQQFNSLMLQNYAVFLVMSLIKRAQTAGTLVFFWL